MININNFGQDVINENDNFVSLREAIIEVNNGNSDNTITLGEGTYVLEIEGKDEDSAVTGDLDITLQNHTITIEGQGKDKTILNANGLDRFFEVHTGATVILSGVTIINGSASVGGAIANQGNLTIINSDFRNNQALGNDGIDGADGRNSLPSSFRNPRRGGAGGDGIDGEDAFGGAIFNSGTVTVNNSEISFNQAIGGDGGNGGDGGTGSNAALSGPPFAAGAGGHGGDGGDGGEAKGGGIYNSGQAVLVDVILNGNSITAGDFGTAGSAGLGGRRTNGRRTGSGDDGVQGISGDAYGSAIYNTVAGAVEINNAEFGNHTAIAGNGGTADNGQINEIRGIFNDSGIISLNSVSQLPDTLGDPLFRFQNSNLPGTYLFAGEGERENIRANFPNFIEEGFAFNVSLEAGDDLIRFNRFQNSLVPGTYLYATDVESANIRANFPNFIEEGTAFYAHGADANKSVDYYRFQNSLVPGTYIFVGESERQNIIANFPNFIEEGVAFEVAI